MRKLENVDVMIGEEELQRRIKELGEQITRDYAGKTLLIICILKGGVMFTVDLSKSLDLDVEYEFMDISSYGAGTESSGIVKIEMDLKRPIFEKDVMLVEDIIDTGRTLSYVVKHLRSQKPKSLAVCTLLDKPDRRVVDDVKPEYIGFTIPDKFVVGYGLDFDQKMRNLSYIGIMNA